MLRATNSYLDHFNISGQLQKNLQAGELHLDLSDIGWRSEIQDGWSGLNKLLSTSFILYMVGIAAAGLNILLAPAVLFRPAPSQLEIFCKGLAYLSFLSIVTASIVVTLGQFKAVGLINTHGNDIGVYAYGGHKYMIVTWMAVLLIYLAAAGEMFRAKIRGWNILREWPEIYERQGVEYINAQKPGPIHLRLNAGDLSY
jgi:hypothetical protein